MQTLCEKQADFTTEKNLASYEKQTIGNEFGIFCCIIITQFHNLTYNFNRWMLTKKSMTQVNLQALLPYAHNGWHDLSIAQVGDFVGGH